MSELEDELRKAKDGKVTGITMWLIDGKWQCNVRRGTGGWIIDVNDDPVAGLIAALTAGQGRAVKRVPAPAELTVPRVPVKRVAPEAPKPASSVFD